MVNYQRTGVNMDNNLLLIVDDNQNIIKSIIRQLRNEEYEIQWANTGEEGLSIIEQYDVGVVISDFKMPGINGVDFLKRVKKINSNIVRILLTAYASMENAQNAINRVQIFKYLSKPWVREEMIQTVKKAFEHYNLLIANERMQQEIKEKNTQLARINKNLENIVRERTSLLEDSIHEGIMMLALAAEAKDDDTGSHLNRISSMTKDICISYGLDELNTEEISFFSITHDIGKMHIPDAILQKPTSLTADEWEIMRSHCIAGEKILGKKPFYKTAREIARCHHEKWDGSGYPDGLKGNKIPLSARIVSIADVFDALTHKRKYKEAWPVGKALDEMKQLSGKSFDPELINLFTHIIENKAVAGNGNTCGQEKIVFPDEKLCIPVINPYEPKNALYQFKEHKIN